MTTSQHFVRPLVFLTLCFAGVFGSGACAHSLGGGSGFGGDGSGGSGGSQRLTSSSRSAATTTTTTSTTSGEPSSSSTSNVASSSSGFQTTSSSSSTSAASSSSTSVASSSSTSVASSSSTSVASSSSTSVASSSSGGPVCGNGICEPGEDSNNCPQDCPVMGGCAHDVCTAGAALDPNCDPCAASVCASDSFCCDMAGGQWDSICVSEVSQFCAKACP